MTWTSEIQLDLPLASRSQQPKRWTSLSGNLRGAIWMLLAAGCYTAMLVLVKAAGERLHPTQILLFRSVFVVMFSLPIILLSFPASLKTTLPHLHAAKTVTSLLSHYLAFVAVIYLPLADATVLGFSKTFFILIIASVLLGEAANTRRFLVISAGFVGVVLVLKPEGSASLNLFGLLALLGAAMSGLADVIARWITKTDKPVTIISYQAIGAVLILALPASYNWTPMTDVDLILLVCLGLVAWVTQYFNTLAFRAGDAAVVAPLVYTRLLYVFTLCFIFLGQWPDPHLLAGAAIIIAAGLLAIKHKDDKSRIGAPQKKRLLSKLTL